MTIVGDEGIYWLNSFITDGRTRLERQAAINYV